MKNKHSRVREKRVAVKTILNQTSLEGAKALGVYSFSHLLLFCCFVYFLAVCLSPIFTKHFPGGHFLGKGVSLNFHPNSITN